MLIGMLIRIERYSECKYELDVMTIVMLWLIENIIYIKVLSDVE